MGHFKLDMRSEVFSFIQKITNIELKNAYSQTVDDVFFEKILTFARQSYKFDIKNRDD